MTWSDAYVGIPYPSEANEPGAMMCFDLFRHVQASAFGRTVPNCAPDQFEGAISRRNEAWEEASSERLDEGDALLFRYGTYALHIATLLTSGRMLHTVKSRGSCVEVWDCSVWRSRFIGGYRYVG